MRHQRFLTAFLSLAFCPASWGALVLEPQSALWLEGDSTLHRYASTATQISFSAEISSSGIQGGLAGTEEAVKRGLVQNLRVMIPVGGLKSGKSGLDENLRRALKSGDHPDIVFTMAGYRLEGGPALDKVVAWGALSVAGVEKPVTLNTSLQWRDGRALMDGEYPLLMTDFGVKPPKLMLGALKTDDRVIVKFHLELGQAADEPETSKGKEEL
jgi:polyisoprenoid-binding protein YceI